MCRNANFYYFLMECNGETMDLCEDFYLTFLQQDEMTNRQADGQTDRETDGQADENRQMGRQ